jgi:hypothetical protein
MERWYLQQYYIFNYIICLVYPLFRLFGSKSLYLQIKDTWGYDKESHIIFGITSLIILKFLKYYSGFKKFLNDSLFLIKAGTLILFIFIKPVYAIWYFFFCLGILIE